MLVLDNIKKENEEVYYISKKIISLNKEDMNSLIELARDTNRKRVRLCCHSSMEEKVHEMVIVHPKNAYVRPHKHINKAESMIVLQGDVDYVTFDSRGNIEEVVSMSDVNSAKPFYQSIRSEIFHTLLIRSEWLVFLEITEGPFNKEDTIFAAWSPEDTNSKEVVHFVEHLNRSINN